MKRKSQHWRHASRGHDHCGYLAWSARPAPVNTLKGVRWRRTSPVLLVFVFTCSVISFAKGLKISPKSCENAIGQYGTCMFVWECIKLDGQHLGTCTDGFLYGSCCQYDDSENSVAGGLSAGSSSASQAPQSPHKPHRPVPVRPAATTSFNSVAASSSSSSSYPQRNFTLIYLTPTSSSQRPTTVKPTAASVTRPATKPSTTATKPTSTPPTSMATATRWPPTFRPPGITTFWSLFRPRPTLVPIITFRPTRRPPFRPSPTAATSTTTTTTTTTVSTMATQAATRPTPSALHNVYGRPSTTRRPAATPTSSALTAVASVTGSKKPPQPPVQLVNKRPKGECGVPTLLPQTKVVGGKSSSFGAWPWQVSVRRTSFFGFSSTHRCGGAILNRYWIATAGHCVDDLLLSQIRIRVGEYDFSSVLEPYPYAERGAKKKVVHPKYNFFTYENDLALVRVDEPLEFMPHIAPICLPPDNESDDLIGRNATVTGWGRLSEGGVLPSVLQEVKVPIVSNEKCKNMFLAAGRHEYIPNIFMCAGFEEGGRDSCQGDSGGPLQIQSKDGRWFLAGIISWGIGCAEPNLPGVCTRISRFKDWIIKSTA